MNFQFITTSRDSRRVDSNTKRKIRSHVIKRHRQSYDTDERREKRRRIATEMPGWKSVVKSLSSDRQNMAMEDPFEDEYVEAVDIDETGAETLLLSVLRTPDVLSGFGMKWDPFESLCIPSTSRIHMLLQYSK